MKSDRKGRGTVRLQAETGVMQPQAKNSQRHQKLEEVRQGKHSLLETSKEAQPCSHCDFKLLATGTVGEYISIVLIKATKFANIFMFFT